MPLLKTAFWLPEAGSPIRLPVYAGYLFYDFAYILKDDFLAGEPLFIGMDYGSLAG